MTNSVLPTKNLVVQAWHTVFPDTAIEVRMYDSTQCNMLDKPLYENSEQADFALVRPRLCSVTPECGRLNADLLTYAITCYAGEMRETILSWDNASADPRFARTVSELDKEVISNVTLEKLITRFTELRAAMAESARVIGLLEKHNYALPRLGL